MKLTTLLHRLNQTMPTGSVPANINPDIINMQLGALRTNQVPAMTFEVKVEANQPLQLIMPSSRTTPATSIKIPHSSPKELPLLFERIGCLLTTKTDLQEQTNHLALKAITDDFDTVLKQSARILGNPLAVVDLVGHPVVTTLKVEDHQSFQQYLQLDNGLTASKSAPPDHFTIPKRPQISLSASQLPLLYLPPSYHNDALGYLVMPTMQTPLNARQYTQFAAVAPIITRSLVKNRIIPTAASKRDHLLTMLLTEQQTETFAAQFARQKAILPSSMALIKAEPCTNQSLAALRERLKYFSTPFFAQTLVTIYHHQCLALVSLDLPEYNSQSFKEHLATIAARTDCRLIVSNQYDRPEDTIAAYAVCKRTAKLKLPRNPVIFCEDAFFDLMLAQVDHVEILPFFINPAVKKLMVYDQTNKTELLPTLDAYLEAGENLTHTAKRLYIHFNTLRYRLNHISELTGLDLKDAETCFKLGASFKVRRYLDHRQLSLHHK